MSTKFVLVLGTALFLSGCDFPDFHTQLEAVELVKTQEELTADDCEWRVVTGHFIKENPVGRLLSELKTTYVCVISERVLQKEEF